MYQVQTSSTSTSTGIQVSSTSTKYYMSGGMSDEEVNAARAKR